MSINLPTVDLSSAIVGTSGKIKIPNPGMTDPLNIGANGYLRLFNESGSGLQLDFSDGTSDTLPAGAWPKYSISPTTSEVKWTVLYTMTNPQVTLLLPVYYYPGEEVPDNTILGNSPVGGSVASTVSTFTLFISPYNFVGGDSIGAGARKTYTVEGGLIPIPMGANIVLANILASSAIAGTYFQVGSQGFVSSSCNFPQCTITQTSFIQSFPSLFIPVNISNGQIDILSNNNAIANITGYIYGYYK